MAAASLAASWGARVAWLYPTMSGWRSRVTGEMALAQLLDRARNGNVAVDRRAIWQLAVEKMENLAILRSPATLAAQGVDAIPGQGQFQAKPELGIRALSQQRTVRSRRYLIAPSGIPTIPSIEGLTDTPFYTLATLEKLLTAELPQRLAVVGNDPQGLVLAQSLAKLGVAVTLLVAETTLLPGEDPAMAKLVQRRLETAGVAVFTAQPVTQVRQIEETIWLQVGDRALEMDAIVVAAGWEADLSGCDWEALGIRTSGTHLRTNRRLQTANSRIYACGNVIGGYSSEMLERYEAQIAARNALILPLYEANYSIVPRIVAGSPPLAAVGASEPQARRRLGDRLVVLSLPFYQVASAQRRGEVWGFGKLLVGDRGEIVGAHFFSDRGPALVQAIAALMRENRSISAFAEAISPDSDVFDGFLAQWRSRWQHTHPRLRSLRQAWFDWQRD